MKGTSLKKKFMILQKMQYCKISLLFSITLQTCHWQEKRGTCYRKYRGVFETYCSAGDKKEARAIPKWYMAFSCWLREQFQVISLKMGLTFALLSEGAAAPRSSAEDQWQKNKGEAFTVLVSNKQSWVAKEIDKAGPPTCSEQEGLTPPLFFFNYPTQDSPRSLSE